MRNTRTRIPIRRDEKCRERGSVYFAIRQGWWKLIRMRASMTWILLQLKCASDGMKERNARKARMRAMDTIENLFVGSEEQIGELFRGAYDLVNNGEILKVTVKVSENRTYTESFNTREGAPQISMKEKQEATTVLA